MFRARCAPAGPKCHVHVEYAMNRVLCQADIF
jgi:hypothetical protein